MFSICTVYVQCMYSVYIVYVQCMYSVCTMYLQCMYNVFTVFVQFMYSEPKFSEMFALIGPFESKSRLSIPHLYGSPCMLG